MAADQNDYGARFCNLAMRQVDAQIRAEEIAALIADQNAHDNAMAAFIADIDGPNHSEPSLTTVSG